MVIETIQVELRRTRDIGASTAKARALVQQAFGMLSERMKAVAEPLKRLYWLELSRLQDNGRARAAFRTWWTSSPRRSSGAWSATRRCAARILSEPDPDEPLRRAMAAARPAGRGWAASRCAPTCAAWPTRSPPPRPARRGANGAWAVGSDG